MKKFCLTICTVMMMLFAVGLMGGQDVQAASIQPEQSTSNLERWYDTCEEVGQKLTKYHFRYSRRKNRTTLNSAIRGYRRANCAAYVSWCLQEYGALKKGQTFYTKSSGKIKRNFKSWGGKVQVIKVNKKPSKANLQPGDIVCWKRIVHTNIYAGKNSSGKRLWIDGGSKATSRGRYKSAGKKKTYGYLEKYKISYIIRIKDLNE